MNNAKSHLQTFIAFINFVRIRYQQDNCSHSAAALTYMTLFSLVPLMTVTYAIISIVPGFNAVGDQIQQLMFTHLVPSTGTEVQEYLAGFSQKARQLSGIGVIFLFVTAYLMLKNIERTLNRIWRTSGNRSGLSGFLLYWAVLSLGPICIALTLAISTYLLSMRFIFDYDVIGILPWLLSLVPYLLIAGFLSLLFTAVPNCRVSIKHAIMGGLLTSLLFECAKRLFTALITNSSYQMIYGAFAALPMFLLWIYLSWLIVLSGAELTHALGTFQSEVNKRFSNMTLSLALLHLLWKRHQAGGVITEKEITHNKWLFDKYSISLSEWTRLRDALTENQLIREVSHDSFVLGKDLHQVNLFDVATALGESTAKKSRGFDQLAQTPTWLTECWQHLEEADKQKQQALATSLAELFSNYTNENDNGILASTKKEQQEKG